MLKFARTTLTVFNVANWVIGILGIVLMVILGFMLPDRIAAQVVAIHPELKAGNIITTFRLAALATPLMIIFVHKTFRCLAAIIDAVPAGDVFSLENANRLHTVGWMLVAINAVDDIFGFTVIGLIGPYSMWSFTLIGWFTALLVFVLALIWREGAAMRADLEGTV